MSFYDTGDNGLWIFLLVTVLIGGSAARATGAAIASTWRPPWQVLALRAAARRRRALLPLRAVLRAAAFADEFHRRLHRRRCSPARSATGMTRVRQMVEQYPGPTSAPAGSGWRRRQELPELAAGMTFQRVSDEHARPYCTRARRSARRSLSRGYP